ncbi:MAG: hypothetical protein ACXV7G_11025 [Halobacteriota archaeon]
MPRLEEVGVSLTFPPFINVTGKWKPDKNERDAAWDMYVELVTRIAVVELKPDEGLLREALSSLHSLFNTTREILKKYGPAVAQRKPSGQVSFGQIAVAILNNVLRPVTAYWHPKLLEYEATKDPGVSALEHEQKWECAPQLRAVLNDIRPIIIKYAETLAEVANVFPLIIDEDAADEARQAIKKCG